MNHDLSAMMKKAVGRAQGAETDTLRNQPFVISSYLLS